jgi:hypothetical protein
VSGSTSGRRISVMKPAFRSRVALSWSARGRSQWYSVANGSIPAGEQLVDEAVVEVDALGFGCPVPSGKIRARRWNWYAVAPIDLISATSSLYRW